MIETKNVFMQRFMYTLNTVKEILYAKNSEIVCSSFAAEIINNDCVKTLESISTINTLENNTSSNTLELTSITTSVEDQC